jgi:hypothetical protein
LYFSAEPSDESHGLFGVIQQVPQRSSCWLMAAGIAKLGLRRHCPEERRISRKRIERTDFDRASAALFRPLRANSRRKATASAMPSTS